MYLEITLCLQLATRGDVGELLNDNKFRRMTVIDEDNFEVEMSKKKIIKILPKQVGFFILDYSKLRMLQFYHEVIDPNISRDDFGYVEMDTDSAYISHNHDKLEDCVRPERRETFYTNHHLWFPAQSCDICRQDWIRAKCNDSEFVACSQCIARQKFDKRTPGLFKVEWKGDGMVALCSKSYRGWGASGDKMALKGIRKQQNDYTVDYWKGVLAGNFLGKGTNRGFQQKNNQTITYSMGRRFAALYPKRKVLPDGNNTEPLDI